MVMPAIDRLAHVVKGQGRDAGGGQGFHFHPGLAGQLAGGGDPHTPSGASAASWTLTPVSISGWQQR